jgi:uncharacterized GH25 family protein
MQPKLVLALVVALLVSAAVWFATRDGGTPQRIEAARTPQAAAGGAGGAALAEAELAASAKLAERAALPEGPGAGGSAAEAAAALESEAALWLAGRVALPLGLPPDERAFVFASTRPRDLRGLSGPAGRAARVYEGRDGEDPSLCGRAELAPDGSFRLPLREALDEVHLAVTGRYLYSLATTPVATSGAEPIVLAAELGAFVDGRLVVEGGGDFTGVEVALRTDVLSGLDAMRLDQIGEARETEAAADGRFEFRGVPGVGAYDLVAKPELAAAIHRTGLAPRPGERLEVELALTQGATVRGRVVAEDGTPLADAEVVATWRGARAEIVGELCRTSSDGAGAFELVGVASGAVRLVASSKGLLEARLDLPAELVDGGLVEGVVLTLGRGARLAGRVLFDDGAPAANAVVTAGMDLSQLGGAGALDLANTRGGSATADADGRFELTGLSDSQFALTAVLEVGEGERAGSWRATRSGVRPSGEELDVVLARLRGLRGRVTTLDSGAPVTEFTVHGTLEGSGAVLGIGATRVTHDVAASEDGAFVLEGLVPGTWLVSVRAPGHAECREQAVTVPQPDDAPAQLFELALEARVRGTVVDPSGRPVAGARVVPEVDVGTRVVQSERGTAIAATSGPDGRFELSGLDAGSHELRASATGFASNDPVSVTVENGATAEGVVLQLRRGGTLVGQVYGDDGAPAAGLMVIVQPLPNQFAQYLDTSDDDGRFRFEHLEPGSWQVVAMRDQRERETSESGADGMAAMLGGMKIEMVTIVDGETTEVVLGEPPPEPVELSVRVTHAGAGVAGAVVSFLPRGAGGANAISGLKMKVTDADGNLVLRLDGAGEYLATVQVLGEAGAQNSVEFPIDVPQGASSHSVEFELPGGSIAGRVRGRDGEPLAGCRITVAVDGGVAYGSVVGGNYVETRTDAEGRYDVPYLRAGTYSVAAGGMPFAGLLGGSSAGGRQVVSGIAVGDGRRVDGVDFELAPAATLAGVVRDGTGAPVPGAGVFVRDARGELVERLSGIATDSSGRFEYGGLAPGEYQVSARKGELTSAESAAVAVDAERRGDVELVLAAGATLLVSVVDGDETLVEASITVVDAAGRTVSGMLALGEIMALLESGLSGKEQRVGPLPPGQYTVRAVHADGRTKERKVSVTGAGERRVRLALD